MQIKDPNTRDIRNLTVFIECIEGKQQKNGSGTLIEDHGRYYVLTAAHCVQVEDKSKFFDKSSIHIYNKKKDEFDGLIVDDVLYKDGLGDIAAIKITLSSIDIARYKDVLSRLSIVEGYGGYQCTISGFKEKGQEWKKHKMLCAGEVINDGVLKYQYNGPDLSLFNDARGYWKGMSGGGLFFGIDNKIYLNAFLIAAADSSCTNNEFLFFPASKFKNLIPEIDITTLDGIESMECTANANSSSHFGLLKQTLLKDEEFPKNPFISAPKLSKIIDILQNEDKDNVLVAALSGLGKSRLLYEAFKANYSLDFCFYALYLGDRASLLKEAKYILDNNENELGIIIVDDCPLDVYQELLKIRDHQNPLFRIICTNHDYFDAVNQNLPGTEYITADDIREEIDNYIDNQLSITDQNKVVRDEIKNISEGYPQMAIALVQAYKEGLNPGVDIVASLMPRILKFEGDDAKKQSIIMQTLSLCQPMSYLGQQRDSFEYMLSSDLFTPLYSTVGLSERKGIAEELIKRLSPALIQKQSSWIIVRPFPLAVFLTRQWFEKCYPERFNELLKDIQKQPIHVQKVVSEGFCKHIEQMHGNKSAFELVEKLVSRPEGSPFQNEEVLCSGLGSRFFLAFSHVNPSAIAKSMWNLFKTKSVNWIKTNLKEEARRNVVFTLEKLCFAKESFDDAIKVLSRLAIAENEDFYGNNASGQIKQLFHIHLAGTEVDLSKRLSILQWMKDLGDDYLNLIIECIDSAFKSSNFIRMGSADRFGLEHKKDYAPKTYEEIYTYWDSVKDVTFEIIREHPSKIVEISKIIENHTFHWFREHHINLACTLIDEILPIRDGKWDSLYESLSRNREHITSVFSEEELNTFNKCMKKLRPNHFISDLNDARHSYWGKVYKLNDDDGEKLSKNLFSNLADKFILDLIFSNKDEFRLLMDDKDYIDFVFIKLLKEKMQPHQVSMMFDTMIEVLKQKDANYQSAFLLTICRVFKDTDGYDSFILKVQKMGLESLYVKLIAINDTTNLKGYILLRNQYEKKENSSAFLNIYLFSSQTEDQDLYEQLLSQVVKDFQECNNLILGFVLRYRFFNIEKLKKSTVDIIKRLILDYQIENENGIDAFDYSSSISKILEMNDDEEFAIKICKKFIEAYNSDILHLNIDKVFTTLLKVYPNIIWDIITEALISKEYIRFYIQIRLDIGSGSGFGFGPLFQVPNAEEKVKKLCIDNPETAPVRIAEMIPCFDYGSNEQEVKGFSSYFIWILENFGNDKNVLIALDANLNRYFHIGSPILYKDRNIFCYKQLLERPKISEPIKQWIYKRIEEQEKDKEMEIERDTYIDWHYGKS